MGMEENFYKQHMASFIGSLELLKPSNGEYHINPDANQKLIPGSKIIVLGKSKQIQNLNSIYNIDF